MTENNNLYKILYEQLPVPRFLIEFNDDEFIVCEVNKFGEKYLDKDRSEIIGQNIENLFKTANFIHYRESFKVVLKKKLTVTIPPVPSSVLEKRIAGFWVNPVLDKEGEILWLDMVGLPSAADISVVERERDDALSLLTSIFDASEVGILVFDKNRRIVKVNDSFERIYGWNKKETIGRDFLDFVTQDEHEKASKSYEGFLLDDAYHSGDVKIFRKNGTIANTLFTTSSLRLSHGRRFQVTTMVDITNRKQIELSLKVAKEQADAANNAKSAFLANMSHELRTPLNAIIGFSEMMKNESFGPLANDKYKEYLTDVYFSARHLLEIINEVLDMSKIEAGKIELDEQDIDLNTLIKTLVRVMGSKTLNTNINILENYKNDIPKLYADARLIRQILINLITNSIKYSIHGGNITVSTDLNNKNEIVIIVTDEGVGIPADRIKDAMEPFGQIHDPSTHSEVYQGTGLGLPLAKAMVEMHGGLFTLKSVENKGTTVHISFSSSRTRHH